MTIAELHGKISHTGANLHDQMEDLLTSDVFSVCKYVRPETLLLPFLRTSVGLDSISIKEHLSSDFYGVDYQFWPMLKRSEPDLLLCLHQANKKHTLVMIEAKYYSAKSGRALDAEGLEVAEAPRDQLACEYHDLLDAHRYFDLRNEDIQYCCLIYLTAHRILPEQALRESIKEISHFVRTETINLFWTSWFKIHPLLVESEERLPWEKPILKDLQLLLERKQLIAFPGFRQISILQSIHRTPLYNRRGYFKSINPIPPLSGFYTRSIL